MFSHSREVFQRATLQGYLGLRKLDQHITDDDILAFHSLNLAFLKAKSFSCRFKEVRQMVKSDILDSIGKYDNN